MCGYSIRYQWQRVEWHTRLKNGPMAWIATCDWPLTTWVTISLCWNDNPNEFWGNARKHSSWIAFSNYLFDSKSMSLFLETDNRHRLMAGWQTDSWLFVCAIKRRRMTAFDKYRMTTTIECSTNVDRAWYTNSIYQRHLSEHVRMWNCVQSTNQFDLICNPWPQTYSALVTHNRIAFAIHLI